MLACQTPKQKNPPEIVQTIALPCTYAFSSDVDVDDSFSAKPYIIIAERFRVSLPHGGSVSHRVSHQPRIETNLKLQDLATRFATK